MAVAVVVIVFISSFLMALFSKEDIKKDENKYTLPLVLSQIIDPENITYEGDISENKLNGTGSLSYFGDTFGLLAEGQFEDGCLTKGVFSFTVSNPDTNKIYSIRNEGFFNENGLTGEGNSKIELIENGDKTSIYLTGTFEDGKLNGLGNMTVFTDAEGKIYEAAGNFKNGVIQKGGTTNE